MRYLTKAVVVLGLLVLGVSIVRSQPKPAAKGDQDSITIVFKDGHQQSFRLADIARIDFAPAAGAVQGVGRAHFTGEWKVGVGDIPGRTFVITLEPDGQARKTLGSAHGIWTVVGGEAHINWDDGWHDAIRKAGNKYEKVAYSPGSSFTGTPDNVTEAVYMESN
ncbi:MAG TPA: hypothetical protein VKU44_11970 [Terriglobia bacterium]|nr:hypothetical protein [Terriglobia bacterium]